MRPQALVRLAIDSLSCFGYCCEIMKRAFIFSCATILVSLAAAPADTPYVQAIEKWRSDEEADLKKEDGWLTLAGLFWLKEGVNTVGAGLSFDVRLTDNFKNGKFGEIEFREGAAKLTVESGIDAQSDGQKITTSVDLVSDEKGKPTEIRTGSQTFYLIRREDRFGIRVKDSQSKTRMAFKGQHWFPIDESYKVTARLEAFAAPKDLMIPNVLGGQFKMKSPGVLKFSLGGKDCSLQPIVNADGSLFIIFRDESSESYSAGRFLHADKPMHGEAILDFNKAENPPCAFTPYATCPLPPPGNELKVAVNAGEKRYDH